MLPIKEDFIPKGNSNRPAYPMKPEYITIHTTRNLNKGADAEMHSRFVKNGGGQYGASWHLTVDDKQIIQHLPFNENGWHAGDGKYGTGNRKSIGIEICENVDGDFEKAVSNAIELVAWLMKKFNIPIQKVVPHKHWSGKQCPYKLLSRWHEIIDRIQSKFEQPKLIKSETIKTPQPAPKGGTYTIQRGDTLSGIAKKFNTTVNELLKANPHIKNPNIIHVGQVINLSSERMDTYTIQKGDTLWDIAKKLKGVTVGDLIKANPNIDPKKLQIGQVINIIRPKSPAPKVEKQKPNYIGKRVESKVDSLRFYNKPSWADKDVAGYVKKGLGFPKILDRVKVENGYQYKVQNSKGQVFYITANEKYVKVI
jgi:N-acetylmuramoyl-L-alanine amidase CwlA